MSSLIEKFSGAGMGPGMEPAKGNFWRNLGMIRPAAWILAVLGFCGFSVVMLFKADLASVPEVFRLLIIPLPGIAVAIYVLLIGFVYVDAKRRGMRYVMWTLLCIFIGNGIGLILYFILRDPMPTPCTKCGFLVGASYSFCPKCGTELFRACKLCHKKLDPNWVNCAYCGAPIGNQPARVG
jgi:RNA polymerase subunit RPABC4/transcription elongation factor Spt4